MKNPIKWLRICYWIGAILDAKAALIFMFPNLIPQLYLAIAGKSALNVSSPDILFRSLSANMIFAWTCLLLWADRKPLERKGVLLLTFFPTVSGIIALRIHQGFYSAKLYGAFTILLIAYALLCVFSYLINTLSKQQ